MAVSKVRQEVSHEEVAQAVIDGLERIADTGEYYRLNHCTPASRLLLGRIVSTWMESQGVLRVADHPEPTRPDDHQPTKVNE
jgi:hypothetical protein